MSSVSETHLPKRFGRDGHLSVEELVLEIGPDVPGDSVPGNVKPLTFRDWLEGVAQVNMAESSMFVDQHQEQEHDKEIEEGVDIIVDPADIDGRTVAALTVDLGDWMDDVAGQPQDFEQIEKYFPNLEDFRLQMGDAYTTTFDFSSIGFLKNLQRLELDFDNNHQGEFGADCLVQAVKGVAKTLRVLYLPHFRFGNLAFLDMVQDLTQLEEFTIGGDLGLMCFDPSEDVSCRRSPHFDGSLGLDLTKLSKLRYCAFLGSDGGRFCMPEEELCECDSDDEAQFGRDGVQWLGLALCRDNVAGSNVAGRKKDDSKNEETQPCRIVMEGQFFSISSKLHRAFSPGGRYFARYRLLAPNQNSDWENGTYDLKGTPSIQVSGNQNPGSRKRQRFR